MDYELPFKNKDVKPLCDKYNIQLSFSTPYYPQANGKAQASNKTVVKALQKFIGESQRD